MARSAQRTEFTEARRRGLTARASTAVQAGWATASGKTVAAQTATNTSGSHWAGMIKGNSPHTR